MCAEWNNGGLPVWLGWKEGIQVRRNNDIWKHEMEKFISEMMNKTSPYFARNGGPIVMAQIENEYNLGDLDYVKWCGALTQTLDSSMPWIMCNGMSAKNTLGGCNDVDCTDFAHLRKSKFPNQPLLWTEDEGYFQMWDRKFGTFQDNRSAIDVSYVVTKWFAFGGAHHNYYMWFGGNHYGRSAAAGVTHKYADGAILHSDGLSNEPKRSHLRALHAVLWRIQEVLLATRVQLFHPIKIAATVNFVWAYRYSTALTFLDNNATLGSEFVWDAKTYWLPPRSMCILYQGEMIYNTSDVSLYPKLTRVYTPIPITKKSGWNYRYEEMTSSIGKHSVESTSLIEQLRLTKDKTDYLAYQFNLSNVRSESLWNWKEYANLTITTCESSSILVYLDTTFVSDVNTNHHDGNCGKILWTMVPTVLLKNSSSMTLVSISMGLGNLRGLHEKGIQAIAINTVVQKPSHFTMLVGTAGETHRIFDPDNNTLVWMKWKDTDVRRPMVWYKMTCQLPDAMSLEWDSKKSILIDLTGLVRGRFWVNGHDMGRYWLIEHDGIPVQRYYHLPPDWLHVAPSLNLVVFLEEVGISTLKHVRLVHSSMEESVSSVLTSLQ